MAYPFSLKPAVLVLALAAIYPLYGHTAAGIAQFTSGDVNVRRGGNVVALGKGRPIESGDDVTTGANGHAQLRFTDGGIVSLQPGSQFVISKYVDANDPKQDSYLVDFLRGSMRSLTGLIGKRNRENYKVQTTTATIGIRGSGFSASYNTDGSIAITTELDEIEVCTRGGCVRLTAGESALVVNNDEAPVRNQIRANLPTPAPRQEVTVVGNTVTAAGLSAIVSLPTIQTVSTGWQGAFQSGGTTYSSSLGANSDGTDQFTLDGTQLTKFVSTYEGITLEKLTLASYGSAGQVADADFIGWGHWATATSTSTYQPASGYGGSSAVNVNDLHYVVGKPTADASMTALNGMTGTYSLIGGTASFRSSYGGSSTVGSVISGGLSVLFQSGYADITGSVATKFGATVVNVNLDAYATGARIDCGASNTISGFFTGANANRAGLVFKTTNTSPTSGPSLGSGTISGSAAFQRTGLSITSGEQ
jgi:hypothetical protein